MAPAMDSDDGKEEMEATSSTTEGSPKRFTITEVPTFFFYFLIMKFS